MYSCNLFLIFYVSVRSLLFLSFTVPIFAWNVPLVSPIFLRSLVFPTLLFSLFLCIVHLRSLSLLSLLFSGTLHSVAYIFPFLPYLLFLLFSQLFVGPPQTTFLHFFFMGMVLITTSRTVLWISIHSSSGTLSTRFNPLNLFVTSTVYS